MNLKKKVFSLKKHSIFEGKKTSNYFEYNWKSRGNWSFLMPD